MRGWLVVSSVCLASASAWCQTFEDVKAEEESAAQAPVSTGNAQLDALFTLLQSEIVVTSATKSALESTAAPSIVTVIPRATIIARGYSSVGEALSCVPGLYVINNLATFNVGVRGITGGADSWSRIIKVMIDGQNVAYQSLSGNLLGPELIPIEAVEAIEVIRGPGSALYGANAFLAVVNVITRHPDKNTATVGGTAASVHGNFGWRTDGLVNVTAGTPEAPRDVLVAYSLSDFDRSGLSAPASSPGIANVANQVSANDHSRPFSGLIRARYDLGAGGQVQFMGLRQVLDSAAEFSEVSNLSHTSRYQMSNNVFRLQHDFAREVLGGQLKWQTHGSYLTGQDEPGQQFLINLAGNSFMLKRTRSNRAWDAGSEVSYQYRQHLALIGVDYLGVNDRGDQVFQESNDGVSNTLLSRGEALSSHNYGVYGQLMVRPFSFVGITGGIRLDVNDLWGVYVNGRVAAVVEPVRGLVVRALYGTSYVPPAPSQLNAPALGPGTVSGNSSLVPQTANTVEGAISYSWGWGLIGANAFFNQVKKRIEFVQSSLQLEAINLSSSHTWGGELMTEVKWNQLFAQANVSFSRSYVEPPQFVPIWWTEMYGDGSDGVLPSYPMVHGNVAVGARFRRYHVMGSAIVTAVGERKSSFSNFVANGNHPYLLAPYALLDLNIRSLDLVLPNGWLIEVSVRISNVFNASISEPGSLGIDIPNLGRSVFGTVKVTL